MSIYTYESAVQKILEIKSKSKSATIAQIKKDPELYDWVILQFALKYPLDNDTTLHWKIWYMTNPNESLYCDMGRRVGRK
jgi:hypothetical protein